MDIPLYEDMMTLSGLLCGHSQQCGAEVGNGASSVTTIKFEDIVCY